MTYEEFINNIIETRGRFACGKHPITGKKLHWIREERVA